MVAERERVFIIGVGCTAFTKPKGQRQTNDMGLEAATKALLDAGITYDAVEAAFVGYVYGDSTCGQAALYQLGLTGIPITNVNNNCATGSVALFHAASLVRAGEARCALALGFERMAPGKLGENPAWPDRPNPLSPLLEAALRASPDAKRGPSMPRIFGAAAAEYFRKYGGNVEHLAKIAAKNHKHSVNNPYAQFRAGYKEAEVLASAQISNELTKFMCSPTSDGAACCIIANEAFVHAHKLENQSIELVATGLATDYPDAFAGRSAMDTVGYGMTRRLSDKVFAQAGATRDDVGVVELHDCFAANELVTYPALGLCTIEDAHRFVERGDNTYGGKYVVNPSGGLEAKGHPLGATGLAMHFSITMQLRNWAGAMQAPGLFDLPDPRGKYGLVHNLGLGGAAVISLLRRPEFYREIGLDGRDRLGYNHAHELRPITRTDVDKVQAKNNSEGLLQLAKL
ncbi:thiolase-like protein [Multifurca ochricompacta]|uniref:Thiolase-like protein n=1 Tax=Multifurca ochricompacta TaxID=376703 RepID=A0AAD4M2N8_9AGAM|nr:thiolase-like protein [Multifurca ochricompacta]